MEQQVEGGKQQLELLIKSQNDLQLQISQSRQRVQHLNDQERGLKHSIASYSSMNSEVSNIFSSQVQDDISTRATVRFTRPIPPPKHNMTEFIACTYSYNDIPWDLHCYFIDCQLISFIDELILTVMFAIIFTFH
eukprot:XP_011420846.1 PREDICTED: uncharacterized protein LOC105323468 [Crassostrea gigas]